MQYLQSLKRIADTTPGVVKLALLMGIFAAFIFFTYPETPPTLQTDVATEHEEQELAAPQLSSSAPNARPSRGGQENSASPAEPAELPLANTAPRRDDPLPLLSVVTEEEIVVLPSDGEVVDIVKEASQRFAQEDVDSAWALETENKIFDLFANDETLSNFVLTNAECKSTECKITLNVTNEDQYYQAATALTQSLFENDNKAVNITLNNDDIRDSPALYLKR